MRLDETTLTEASPRKFRQDPKTRGYDNKWGRVNLLNKDREKHDEIKKSAFDWLKNKFHDVTFGKMLTEFLPSPWYFESSADPRLSIYFFAQLTKLFPTANRAYSHSKLARKIERDISQIDGVYSVDMLNNPVAISLERFDTNRKTRKEVLNMVSKIFKDIETKINKWKPIVERETTRQYVESMEFDEAKQLLESAGYRVINEKEINLNYLLKDIFELLTSFGISATDDEVESLMWTYINSGRKPENATAEDVLEFDIDNDPDTIINYTGEFVDWIKRGQYKTGPVDESIQMNEDINNPDEPASKKQLWALFCITKQDWRNKNLTKGEASELIQKYSDERHKNALATAKSKQSLASKIGEDIMNNLKPELDAAIESAYGNQSVVGDADLDGNLIPGGKRYKFFGGGCGFAWVKYDHRNKKLGEVIDKYVDIYRKAYFRKFANEYIKKYKEKELGAVLSQDIDVQCIIKQAALDFAKSIGINTKGAYVDSRLD